MGRHPVETDELVRQLRLAAERSWEPPIPGPLSRPAPSERMRAHPGLDYAHHHWTLPDQPPPTGTDVKGRVRMLAGRAVFGIFSDYLGKERELVSSLVRLGDALAIRCDELTAQLEGLRNELDERTRTRAAADAELAGVVDGLRRQLADLETRLHQTAGDHRPGPETAGDHRPGPETAGDHRPGPETAGDDNGRHSHDNGAGR